MQTNQISSAIATYRLLLAQAPNAGDVHMALAQAQITGGFGSLATKSLRRAIELDPSLAPAMVALARIKLDEKQLGEAKSWYQRALTVDDSRLDAASGLAGVLIQEN